MKTSKRTSEKKDQKSKAKKLSAKDQKKKVGGARAAEYGIVALGSG